MVPLLSSRGARTPGVTKELGRIETPAREYSTFPFVPYLGHQSFS